MLAALPAPLASVLAAMPPPPPRAAPAPAPGPAPEDEGMPKTFVELRDLASACVRAEWPGFWAGQVPRETLAPSAPVRVPKPLLPGTEAFTNPFHIDWHSLPRDAAPREVACSFATGAIVTGQGHIWLDGKMVTAPQLMPFYVYNLHQISEQGPRLLEIHTLPLREIAAPCAVLLGHGLHVYGHFLIEMLFRVLLVRRALRGTGLRARWLLAADAPAWLLRILAEDLDIPREDIEFFRPLEERVRLRQAILPDMVHDHDGFHPFTDMLIEDLLAHLAPLPEVAPAPRLFVGRRGFRNPESQQRECRNEAALVALAEARGFVAIAPEELPWRQQLALFRQAGTIAGLFGSGLHTALVCPAGTRVGVLGVLNTTQSEIGALRGHSMAYMTEGFSLEGQFTVPQDAFAAFLDALIA